MRRFLLGYHLSRSEGQDRSRLPFILILLCGCLIASLLLSGCNPSAGKPPGGTTPSGRTTSGGLQLASGPDYLPMEFTGDLEWSLEPLLVRMVPDAKAEFGRRPLDALRDADVLLQPVFNVVVLVHGHSEEEKDGRPLPTAGEPWLRSYKRDCWTQLYRTFLEEYGDSLDEYAGLKDCTAFYEFIYPTYRPIFSPIQGRSTPTLAQSFAQSLIDGASNDKGQLKTWLDPQDAKKPANLFIVAHSQGGLVARAGLQLLPEPLASAFQRLVTWGAPHRGSALYTLARALIASPAYEDSTAAGQVCAMARTTLFLTGWYLRKIADDTPAVRDMRWEAPSSSFSDGLNLDCLYRVTTAQGGEKSKEFDLVKGTWLYNENLALLNAKDRFGDGSRYSILYGISPQSGSDTGIGANLNGLMIRGGSVISGSTQILQQDGFSDGAVPWASLTARGLFAQAQRVNLGQVDHEQYFGSPNPQGVLSAVASAQKTARETFEALDLTRARCLCPGISITTPANETSLEGPGKPVDVEAVVYWPAEFDPRPYERVLSAQVLLIRTGAAEMEPLGALTVNAAGLLSGSFVSPEVADCKFQIVVRAMLKDRSQLESRAITLTLAQATPTPTVTPAAEPTLTPTTAGDWVLESVLPFPEPGYWGNDCYSNFQVSVGDGAFASSYSWKDDGCMAEGGPYYSGSVQTVCSWTTPPSYLQSGSRLSLSASCQSTAQQTGGGRNSGGGGGMYLTVNPRADNLGGRFSWSSKFLGEVNAGGWSAEMPVFDGKSGSIEIPQGKKGDVLVFVGSWSGPGGGARLVYKYVCGATAAPPNRSLLPTATPLGPVSPAVTPSPTPLSTAIVSPTVLSTAIPSGTQQPAETPFAVAEEFFVVRSTGLAYNGPTAPTTFTIGEFWLVTRLLTYHWNDGQGATPGIIALQSSDGILHGSWRATGEPGSGVPNAAWVVEPNILIPPGTYTVLDSEPSTWAQNQETGGAGMAWGNGIRRPSPTATPNPTAKAYVGGFVGRWDTNWGQMTCTVDGLHLHCEYTHDEGRIDATLSADGRTMEGQWAEWPSYSPPGDGGRVAFVLAEDGETISGDWSYGEEASAGTWTGTRIR